MFRSTCILRWRNYGWFTTISLLYHLIFLLLHVTSVIKKKLISISIKKGKWPCIYFFSYTRVIFLSLHGSKDRLIHLNSLNPALSLAQQPPPTWWTELKCYIHIGFQPYPIAKPAVSWESFRAFSVNVHFLNYCPPPSFTSSIENQRLGEKLKWLRFYVGTIAGRKRNLSLELGSIPMATRKSGDLQPRSRVRMTKTKHPE